MKQQAGTNTVCMLILHLTEVIRPPMAHAHWSTRLRYDDLLCFTDWLANPRKSRQLVNDGLPPSRFYGLYIADGDLWSTFQYLS